MIRELASRTNGHFYFAHWNPFFTGLD